MLNRDIYRGLWADLAADKAMIFLAGPRQAGKTTLAKSIAEDFPDHLYFNWDQREDRARLLKDPRFFRTMPRKSSGHPLIVFDEIHKYRHWKNYLKGIYDEFSGEFRFLVSGSGRLDLYQRGGDSLAGRYLLFHLWPLVMTEFRESPRSIESWLADPLSLAPDHEHLQTIWSKLQAFGGFPEPFVNAKERSWRRWSQTYHRQLLREDMRDVGGLSNVQGAEDLFSLLPERVGSPLSMNSLAGDIGVSPHTVKKWIELFDRFFLSFRLSPWTGKLARAITKEKKLYLFDSPLVSDEGRRFENAVALELNRAVHTWSELGHGDYSLHYVRNKEKQEVDFLIVRDRKPLLLVETKLSERSAASSLLKLQAQLGVPAVQLFSKGEGTFKRWSNNGLDVMIAPAWRWLVQLP